MKKSIIVLMLIILFITGCTKNDSKISLEKKYYKGTTFINSSTKEVNDLLDSKESFILYTYNNYCLLDVPCEDIFKEFMKKYKIQIISIPFDSYKETKLYYDVKYAPTVIIINQGKIEAYLDANSNDDLNKYQNIDEFYNWINEYVNI